MNDEPLAQIEREVLGWGLQEEGRRRSWWDRRHRLQIRRPRDRRTPDRARPRRRPRRLPVPQRGQGRVDPLRTGDPSSRVPEQPDDGELQDRKRRRCTRSPGTLPHELRAKEGTKRADGEGRLTITQPSKSPPRSSACPGPYITNRRVVDGDESGVAGGVRWA
jgi:hypothetical protein